MNDPIKTAKLRIQNARAELQAAEDTGQSYGRDYALAEIGGALSHVTVVNGRTQGGYAIKKSDFTHLDGTPLGEFVRDYDATDQANQNFLSWTKSL